MKKSEYEKQMRLIQIISKKCSDLYYCDVDDATRQTLEKLAVDLLDFQYKLERNYNER